MVLQILSTCQKVVSQAKDVQIISSNIPELALKIHTLIEEDKLTLDEFKKCPLHPKNEDEEAINWIFIVDSLNYCFFDPDNKSHWSITWKNEKHTGYFGLCAAINRAMEKGINMTDMNTCLELTRQQLDEILLGDDGATLPLLQERYLCLQQSADVLLKKYKGNFVNCILESNHSAQKLLEIISENFFHFRDESIYNNQTGNVIYYPVACGDILCWVSAKIKFQVKTKKGILLIKTYNKYIDNKNNPICIVRILEFRF